MASQALSRIGNERVLLSCKNLHSPIACCCWRSIVLLPIAAAGGAAGGRRASRRGRHPQTAGQAADALHRRCGRGDRPPAGRLRAGLSAMVQVFRRQGERPRRLARHGLPDEGQGPVRRGRPAARRMFRRPQGPRLSRSRTGSGFTSSRATSIAANCCCTRGRTVSCSRCWAVAARRGTWKGWRNIWARTASKTAG